MKLQRRTLISQNGKQEKSKQDSEFYIRHMLIYKTDLTRHVLMYKTVKEMNQNTKV